MGEFREPGHTTALRMPDLTSRAVRIFTFSLLLNIIVSSFYGDCSPMVYQHTDATPTAFAWLTIWLRSPPTHFPRYSPLECLRQHRACSIQAVSPCSATKHKGECLLGGLAVQRTHYNNVLAKIRCREYSRAPRLWVCHRRRCWMKRVEQMTYGIIVVQKKVKSLRKCTKSAALVVCGPSSFISRA